MSKTEVWSCGGGTQSAAIAALIVKGILPKPDIALMVDTEREKTSTWEYANTVLIPELHRVGVELIIVKKSDFAKNDLIKSGHLILPMYTNQSGQISKMGTFCSNEWKRRVAQRYLRSVGIESCRCWLGMSMDEMHRAKKSDLDWYEHYYPLIDTVPMRRRDCYTVTMGIGWPKPPRSACWMCPHMSDKEWKEVRDGYPGDFQKAIEIDNHIRLTDPHAFLHQSCLPLEQVDFDAQISLFGDDGGCKSGYCFT